jgi:hypothetical protein
VSLVQKDLQDAAFDLQRRLGYEQELHWPDFDALLDRGRHDAKAAVGAPKAARPTAQQHRRPPQRSRRRSR